MRKAVVLASVIVMALGGAATAQDKRSGIELLEQIEALEKASNSADQLMLAVDRMSRKKYSDCMKAFGSQKFCACLRDKSPVGISFVGYVHIVTTPKAEIGYAKASAEDKAMIDRALETREACVTR